MNSLAAGIRTGPPVRCPGRARHWFSLWGRVGSRSPVCVSCGYPNPKPLTDNDWNELIQYRDLMSQPFRLQALEDAINARKTEMKP